VSSHVGSGHAAEIRVRANSFLAGMVGGRKIDMLAAAQMSLPYAVAARIVLGTAGLSAYAESRRSDPALRAMLDRVFIDIDDSVTASEESAVTFRPIGWHADRGTNRDRARRAGEPDQRRRPDREVRGAG
jgi:2-methylcitrate dehydratase PrpD